MVKKKLLNLKKMDKMSVVRTLTLVVALINQLLSIMGKSPLPIDSHMVEQVVSFCFTTVASFVAWKKNNFPKDGEIDRK